MRNPVHQQRSSLFVWSVEWTTLLLLLMLCEHGHKEVCPSPHAIADQVKLLEARVRLFICPVVNAGHRDQIGPSLALCGGSDNVRTTVRPEFSPYISSITADLGKCKNEFFKTFLRK